MPTLSSCTYLYGRFSGSDSVYFFVVGFLKCDSIWASRPFLLVPTLLLFVPFKWLNFIFLKIPFPHNHVFLRENVFSFYILFAPRTIMETWFSIQILKRNYDSILDFEHGITISFFFVLTLNKKNKENMILRIKYKRKTWFCFRFYTQNKKRFGSMNGKRKGAMGLN